MSGQSACASGPYSVPMNSPWCSIGRWFSLSGETEGHTETTSLTPSSSNSLTIAAGSGHSAGSNRHSPRCVQWKKSQTIAEIGRSRLRYSRATDSSSSWVR